MKTTKPNEKLEQLFIERCINVSAFARENKIKPTTLYSILCGKTDIEKVGIDNFMKISKGLGYETEKLYYYVMNLEEK